MDDRFFAVVMMVLAVVMLSSVALDSELISNTYAESEKIPDWVKSSFKYYADDLITDNELIQNIEYLIEKGIVKIESNSINAGQVLKDIQSSYDDGFKAGKESVDNTSNDGYNREIAELNREIEELKIQKVSLLDELDESKQELTVTRCGEFNGVTTCVEYYKSELELLEQEQRKLTEDAVVSGELTWSSRHNAYVVNQKTSSSNELDDSEDKLDDVRSEHISDVRSEHISDVRSEHISMSNIASELNDSEEEKSTKCIIYGEELIVWDGDTDSNNMVSTDMATVDIFNEIIENCKVSQENGVNDNLKFHRVTFTMHPDSSGCKEFNSCFNPSFLDVSVGDTVIWFNTAHSVDHVVTNGIETEFDLIDWDDWIGGGDWTGFEPSGLFDSGLLYISHVDGVYDYENSYFSYTFEREGYYVYYCTVHPWAYGTVHVR